MFYFEPPCSVVTEYDQIFTMQHIVLFCAELSALYSDVKSTCINAQVQRTVLGVNFLAHSVCSGK